MIGDSGFHNRDIWEQLPVVNILNQLIMTYWCLAGNGWEWGNGMIITSDYGSFPHSIWWFGTWILFSPIVGMMIQSDFHIFQKGRYTTNQIMIMGSIWDKLIEVGVCQFMVSYCYGSNMYKILAFGDTHKTPHMLVYVKSEMHVVSRYPYCWMMGTHHDPIISRYHCLFLWCNITMENHHFLWVNPL